MCGNCCGRKTMKTAAGVDDLRGSMLWRGFIAEFIGTMFLVFIGCGACLSWGDYKPNVTSIALAFGLGVATIVWGIAHISGGHINPAVTIAFLITRKISFAKGFLFVLAQSAGGITGAAILKGLTPEEFRGSLGATTPNPYITQGQAFGVEFMITFVLVFTVFASCDGNRVDLNGSGPLSIGLSVTLCHLFAIVVTGSSMNPARTLGPAVLQRIWTEHWVYWCGPILGGVVAAVIYESLFAKNASLNKARGYLLAAQYDPDTRERRDSGDSSTYREKIDSTV